MRRSPRLLVVLLTLSLGALAACTGGSDAVDQTAGGEFRFVSGTPTGETIAAADRKSAPAVTGTLLAGGSWNLQAQRGKVVVLNFWASWCGPCRVESPDFDKVSKATKAQGVEFVGVAVRDDKQKATDFQKDRAISYPSLFDPPGKTVQAFRDLRVGGFPFTIIIDRQGRVAAVYVSALVQEDIQPVVTRLAAET
ncbi:MAG TPA: TlpA disulfide reductase family protein [Mycobacteriales bacterium]|nr:TlpA disulfide reductase family protein [Mycobacteriales bacterium]